MSIVEKLTAAISVLLYSNYNKTKFDEFTEDCENLIILEAFLRKSNFLITNAVKETVVGQGES